MRKLWLGFLVLVMVAPACSSRPAGEAPAGAAADAGGRADARASEHGDADARFAEVQERGREAMGVDQYTSTHVFEPLPDGGRIELQRDSADAAGATVIQTHMDDIRAAFSRGDFRIPGFVHAMKVPGTDVMAARRDAIRYEVRALPRGAELRLVTSDTTALRAIHAFLAFQRSDHRAHAH